MSAEDSGIAGLGQIDVQYRVGGGEWAQWHTLGSSEGLPVFWETLVYSSRSAAGVWSRATALDRASRPPWLHLDADGHMVLVSHCSGRLGCPDDAGAYTRVLTPGRGRGRGRGVLAALGGAPH